MLFVIQSLRSEAQALCASADPELFTCADALVISKELAATVNLLTTLGARFAHRAAEGRVGGSGVRRPRRRRKAKTNNRTPSETAKNIASATGQDPKAVQGQINTIDQLEDLPETSSALNNGTISMDQAAHIGATASEVPEAEDTLLNTARQSSVDDLAEEASRIRANARSAEERLKRSEQAKRNRSFRAYRDKEDDTQYKVFVQGPIEDLAEVNAAIESGAKATKDFASHANRRYDAFLNAVRGRAKTGRSAKKQVLINVDLAAFTRGYTTGEERCTIPGVGEVPVSEAWDDLNSSIVRLLAKNGEAVMATATVDGRKITAETFAIAVARDPICANPGCQNEHGLELDHRRPVADHGPGVLSNLAMLCPECHYAKTHHGYCLVGPRGSWQWVKRRLSGDGGIGYPLDHDEDPLLYASMAS